MHYASVRLSVFPFFNPALSPSHTGRGTPDEHDGAVQTHREDGGSYGPLPGPGPQLHEGHPRSQHQLRGLREPQDKLGGAVTLNTHNGHYLFILLLKREVARVGTRVWYLAW